MLDSTGVPLSIPHCHSLSCLQRNVQKWIQLSLELLLVIWFWWGGQQFSCVSLWIQHAIARERKCCELYPCGNTVLLSVTNEERRQRISTKRTLLPVGYAWRIQNETRCLASKSKRLLYVTKSGKSDLKWHMELLVSPNTDFYKVSNKENFI